MLWVGGYTFETPPPLVTKEGIKPFPATGVRKLHSRTVVLLRRHRGHARDVHAAHRNRVAVPHGHQGRRREPPRRRADLPGDAAAGHPGGPLLVVHRSTTTRRARCSQTPQRFPRAGSQSYPTPAATANADGSTTITFGPERPSDSPEGNWIQTTEGKGWFPILRLYSPLEPFFDKTWRPSEIEAVT